MADPKQPDAYTEAIQGVDVGSLWSAVAPPAHEKSDSHSAYTNAMIDVTGQSLLDTLSSVASSTAAAVRDALDIQSFLPEPNDAAVRALLLDDATAQAQMAAAARVRPIQPEVPAVGAEVGAVSPPSATRAEDPRNDVTKTLSGFIGTPSASRKEPALSARAAHMLDSFQRAFPDKEFKVTEANGQVTIEDLPKKQQVGMVPTTYDPASAQIGLKEMQSALTRETDPRKQLEIAYQIKAAVATQSAAKYQQYVNQANVEAGVPDLIQAVATSRQLDAMSPAVRASGAPSKQTNEALAALASARMHSASRVRDLMNNDPTISEPFTLADLTIQKLDKAATLDKRLDDDALRTERKQQREAAIAEVKANPTIMDRIAILTTGAPPPQDPTSRTVLATNIADRKYTLSQLDRTIVEADKDSLRSLYLAGDQTVKAKVLPVMRYEEAKSLRGKVPVGTEMAKATEQLALFDRVMKTDIKDPSVPEEIRRAYAQGMQGAAALHGAEKTKAEQQVNINAHLAYADVLVKAKHSSDVREWQGTLQTDATAKATLAQFAESKPGKPVSMKEFVTGYLNYNDGRNKADKITALRSFAAASIEALPDSIILPKPAPTSYVAEIDRYTSSFLTGLLSSYGTAASTVLQQTPQFQVAESVGTFMQSLGAPQQGLIQKLGVK